MTPEEIAAVPATLASVWRQALHNHETYSATGSVEDDIRFHGLGLSGEAGEALEAAILVAVSAGKVANEVKKHWRDGGRAEELRKECSDVFAYNIMLAQALGMGPQDLLDMVAYKQQVFVTKMQAKLARTTLSPKED